jgi:hypothetical protein
MPELFAHLVEFLAGTLLGPILIGAALAGWAAHHFAAADLEDPAGRQRVRVALEAGGRWRRLYVFLLTRGLNRLDRFLGDADKAAFSLPSPFRNREAWPYWTGWSFDRCALLALIYPLASLFAVWVWTGQAGAIGNLIGFYAAIPSWSRAAVAVAIGVIAFAFQRAFRGRQRVLWLTAAGILSLIVVIAISGFVTSWGVVGDAIGLSVFIAGSMAIVDTFIVSQMLYGVISISATMCIEFGGIMLFTVATISHEYGPSLLGIVIFFGGIIVCSGITVSGFGAFIYIASRFDRRNQLGRLWQLTWPSTLVLTYLGITSAAGVGVHRNTVGLNVLFALVPIVNVPFDWASVGLTRALLRRGCEPDAPSPLWLGVLDFVFGLILLFFLAIALIAALQAADAVIIHFGGKPVANVVALLDTIAENPRDPGNYWAYFTLFSTLIPSALNAVIGAVSLIGWSWRPAREWVLIQLLALDRAQDKGIRVRVAALLGLQVGLGTALTGIVLWCLWEALLATPYVLPLVLDGLKHFALALA